MTARRAFGLLVVATVGAVVLHGAGSTLPAPPLADPARLAGWWTGQGTPAAVLSVARIVGMALCCYLALISLLGTVASLTRWRWTQTLAIWVATPALRRMIAGGTLAAAMTSSYTAAAAPVAYVVTDLGEAQATAAMGAPADMAAVPQELFDVHRAAVPQERLDGHTAAVPQKLFDVHTVTDIGAAPVGPARYSVSDLGPAHAESEDRLAGPADDRTAESPQAGAAAGTDDSPRTTTSDTARTNSGPHTTTRDATRTDHQAHTTTDDTARADDQPHATTRDTARTDHQAHPAARDTAAADDTPDPGGLATWIVEPGDHLWGIAAATVAERSGSEDRMEVARYWLKLIEANADTVGDNPDLILPGQLIRLPG